MDNWEKQEQQAQAVHGEGPIGGGWICGGSLKTSTQPRDQSCDSTVGGGDFNTETHSIQHTNRNTHS